MSKNYFSIKTINVRIFALDIESTPVAKLDFTFYSMDIKLVFDRLKARR